MTTTNYRKLDCPIAESLSVIGDQWTLLIIRDSVIGISSFTGFEQSLGISRRLLSRRLVEMEQNGLIDRVPVKPGAARMKYVPTQKGLELGTILLGLAEWGEKWHPGIRGARYKHVHLPTGATIHTGTIRDDTGKAVPIAECVSLPGPGADAASRANSKALEARARKKLQAKPSKAPSS